MPRWEYLVVVVNGAGEYMLAEVDEQGDWQYKPINELGTKGWELVAVDFSDEGGLGFFKRPLAINHRDTAGTAA